MLFKSKKPLFDEVDGEYVIPLRMSVDLAHHLLSGWWPLGFGWAHFRARPDGSHDLFIRGAELREDLNLVSLDAVKTALIAALDLADTVIDDEDLISDDTLAAAREVKKLVSHSAQ